MRRHHRSRRTMAGLLFLCIVAACGGTDPVLPANDADGPGISGVLVSESGEAIPYVNVMACTLAVCYYADSDRTGRFEFLLDSPGVYLIKTSEDLSSRPRRTSPMVPVIVEGDEFIDLGNVSAPMLPADVPVGADGVVEAGDGLTLVFDPAAPGTPDAVAARRIPDAIIPEFRTLPDEHVVAVYALHPFALKTEAPVGVRVMSDSGNVAAFRTIDEIDGSFSDPVPGQTVQGAWVSLPGTGITSLTHLVVVGEN